MTAPSQRIPAWGIPAVVAAFGAWLFGGIAIATVVVVLNGSDAASTPLGIFAVLVGQSAAALAALVVISASRGQRSLARDFGLRAALRDLKWLPVGGAIQVIGIVVMYPVVQLSGEKETSQQLVTTIQDAPLIQRLLLVIGVVVLVPLVEELLFRGALLRALLRHLPVTIAIVVDALAFAAAHLLDPKAIYALPALATVGTLAGWLAVRSGRIGPAIALHAGFNFLAVVLMFLT
ncbi:MAG: type II CAAX prenyl endopeptidase Rce1 family protein [Acidimicrobiia bacterium]